MRTMLSQASGYLAQRRVHRTWLKVLFVLACAVVFCTTYALILPAMTLEHPLCGLEEHTHTEACYTLVATPDVDEGEEAAEAGAATDAGGDAAAAATQTQIVCSYESLGVHQHTADCYDDQGNLICGYADYVVHTHTAECYDADGNLICGLPEVEAHTHTDACYTAVTTEGHVHTADCYTLERGELICGLEEGAGAHTHTAECYDADGNLICGLEESAGHVHTDDCYAWNEVLTCTQSTDPVTTYVLTCDKPEIVLHTHTDACYDPETGALICGQVEVREHVHDASCFQTVEVEAAPDAVADATDTTDEAAADAATGEASDATALTAADIEGLTADQIDLETIAALEPLTCGLEEDENHTHTVMCYGTWELTCGLEEHTHTDACYDDDAAEGEADAGAVLPEGAQVPEGYTQQFTYQDEANGFAVTVYAPEGTVPEGATLVASLLDAGSDAYAVAEQALTVDGSYTGDADAAVTAPSEGGEEAIEVEGDAANETTSGLVALDIHFEDADGNEVEPAGDVYVAINAAGLLSDDADPATLTVQHLVEDESGAVASVDTVADTADASAGVVASEDGDVQAAFEVSGFSTFTIGWAGFESSLVEELADTRTISWSQLKYPTTANTKNKEAVNFYLNLYSNIANSDEGGDWSDVQRENFTTSLLATNLADHPNSFSYTEELDNNGSLSSYIVIQGNTNGSAYDADAQIRQLGTTGIGEFYIADFPSDEEIFEKITADRNTWNSYTKNQGIQVGNTTITWENHAELNTNNYTIRWYVFKYQLSDAWHVDGILVPKYGRLTITKTFDFGQPDLTLEQLLDLVPDNFVINVEATDGQQSYALQMKEATANDPLARPGWSKYTKAVDSKGNSTITFTWEVDILEATYQISEQGCYVEGYDFESATYSTSPSSGDDKTGSLTDESSGFTIGCVTTATDESGGSQTAQQSAALTNSYMPTGSLTVTKDVEGAIASGESFWFTVTTSNREVDGKTYSIAESGETVIFVGPSDGEYVATVSISATTAEGEGHDGSITIEGLPLGEYTVQELTLTDLDESHHLSAVTYVGEQEAGNSTVEVTARGDAEVNVVNTYATDISVEKIDAVTKEHLNGAGFVLTKVENGTKYYYNENATQETGKWVPLLEGDKAESDYALESDSNGLIYFSGIEDGEYVLKEVVTPDGYNSLSSPINITVSDGKIKTAAFASGGMSSLPIDEENGLCITVENNPGVELPETGGSGTLLYTLGGLLLMAGALMCGLMVRRNRERRERE